MSCWRRRICRTDSPSADRTPRSVLNLPPERYTELTSGSKGRQSPKYQRASKTESEFIRERLAKMPPEKKVQQCVTLICGHLNKNDRYAAQEISAYVRRVVENMAEDELAAMETAIPTYARKIQTKITALEDAYQTSCPALFNHSGLRNTSAPHPKFTPLNQRITPSSRRIPQSFYPRPASHLNTGNTGGRTASSTVSCGQNDFRITRPPSSAYLIVSTIGGAYRDHDSNRSVYTARQYACI